MPPQVHKGLAGGGNFLAGFLRGRDPDRVLLVCKPNSFEASGARDWFRRELGRDLPAFSDFSPNPKEGDVIRGVERFRRLEAEAVVAVGGGSVLDMAKLINFFGSRQIGLDDCLKPGAGLPSVPVRPLLAVPTTAGSGSEATHFAVVYRGSAKHSVADGAIRPSHVLLAPEFTGSLDAYQTACTGMDALAQAIESEWARAATEESRRHAREARQLAFDHLPGAVHAPDLEHRAAMLEAAHLAGRAIDVSKTTGAHAFSYALTSAYGLPHGHAVALLLPFFIGWHERAGLRVDAWNEERLRGFIRGIGLERRLPVTADELCDLLTREVNPERLANNPVDVSPDFVRRMAEGLAGRE